LLLWIRPKYIVGQSVIQDVMMSTLSVRLPKELDRAMPRKARSAWVVDAIREKLISERMKRLGEAGAAYEKEQLEALAEWEPATAPLRLSRPKRGRK
jgi:hypothetical protein